MKATRPHPITTLRSLLPPGTSGKCSLRDFADQLEGISFSQVGRVERYELPVSKTLSQKVQQVFGAWVAPGHYYSPKGPNTHRVPLKSDDEFLPRAAYGTSWDRFSRRTELLGSGVPLYLNGGGYQSIDELAEDCFKRLKETRGMRGTGKVRVFPSAIALEPYDQDSFSKFTQTARTSDVNKASSQSSESHFGVGLDAGDQYIISLLSALQNRTQRVEDHGTLLNLKQALREAMRLKSITDAQYRAIESFRNLFTVNGKLPLGVKEPRIKELMWANKIWTHPGEVPSPPALLEWFNEPKADEAFGPVDFEEVGMTAPLWLENFQRIRPTMFEQLMEAYPIDRRILSTAPCTALHTQLQRIFDEAYRSPEKSPCSPACLSRELSK